MTYLFLELIQDSILLLSNIPILTFILCDTPCSICSRQYVYHKMKCRDWGSNVLCRKVKNIPDGERIVMQKLFYSMKHLYETYFGIGTHRRWHKVWMIVDLFWFKKNL